MEAVKDESVDVVVVTLVLCSLPSETIQATLKEIQRVLVPVSESLTVTSPQSFSPAFSGLFLPFFCP